MKLIGSLFILGAMATVASAQTAPAPEIDGNSAITALAFVSGGLLVLRGGRKK